MKGLPIGISDFKTLIEKNYYYFDKTDFIENISEEAGKTLLFTRPRRFGKTLNLSMLKYFFDIREKDQNKNLFTGLKIEKTKKIEEQGKYPVIFISFKDIKEKNWQDFIDKLNFSISELFKEYTFIQDELIEEDLLIFKNLMKAKSDFFYLGSSLKFLTKILFQYYNEKVVLLIDEYDSPIVSAYEYNYYDEAINFFRNFLSSALKDNSYIHLGIMTGILRVAKEGIFSGLNNLIVHSVLDKKYNSFFGLTETEVKKALCFYKIENNMEEVKKWYDGYNFADQEIYNPWSIVNFIENRELDSYWIGTSDNYLIKSLLNTANIFIFDELKKVFNYQTIEKVIDKSSNLLDIKAGKELWELLLHSGYMTVEKKISRDFYSLRIVNNEVHSFFDKIFIDEYLIDRGLFSKLMTAFLDGDFSEFEKLLQNILYLNISYYDTDKQEEKFYHNLILGMVLYLDREYIVSSNKESGIGRYDIVLEALDKKKKSYILEFKIAKTKDELEEKAREALEQIEDKNYEAELKKRGYNNILKLGIAFCGKNVKIEYN